MKERPILFSAPMVRTILAGTKTQTRRAVKHAPALHHGNTAWDMTICPYGRPGDRLWVREAHTFCPRLPSMKKWSHTPEEARVIYGTDDVWMSGPYGPFQPKKRPSIHMPRWASRITLEVVAVRVERLNEITAGDCIAEGIIESEAPQYVFGLWEAYRDLWESINGPGSWIANPWVWVIEFRRIKP